MQQQRRQSNRKTAAAAAAQVSNSLGFGQWLVQSSQISHQCMVDQTHKSSSLRSPSELQIHQQLLKGLFYGKMCMRNGGIVFHLLSLDSRMQALNSKAPPRIWKMLGTDRSSTRAHMMAHGMSSVRMAAVIEAGMSPIP